MERVRPEIDENWTMGVDLESWKDTATRTGSTARRE